MSHIDCVNRPRLLLLLPVLAGFAGVAGMARAEERHAAHSPANTAAAALYREECGGCHVPFPPRALPAASWRQLMSGLEQHFGTDASIDTEASRIVGAWLQVNAGRKAVTPVAKPVLRVTGTEWFRHEHDEIAGTVFRRPSVKSAANCSACHRGAAEGRFGEREIRIAD